MSLKSKSRYRSVRVSGGSGRLVTFDVRGGDPDRPVEALGRERQERGEREVPGDDRIDRVGQEVLVLEAEAVGDVAGDARPPPGQVDAAGDRERVRGVVGRQRGLPAVGASGRRRRRTRARPRSPPPPARSTGCPPPLRPARCGRRKSRTRSAAATSPGDHRLEAEIVDGLVDRLEDLVEVVAGTAECHTEGPLAVFPDPRVLGGEIDPGRRRQLEEEPRLVPLQRDLVQLRGRVVQRSAPGAAWAARRRRARASVAMNRALVEKMCGIWFHSNPPSHRPRRPAPSDVLLVLQPPRSAPQLEEEPLVGREEPEPERLEEEALLDVPVLLELGLLVLRRLTRQEAEARLDVALEQPAAELGVCAQAGPAASGASSATRIRPNRPIALMMRSYRVKANGPTGGWSHGSGRDSSGTTAPSRT